MKTITKLAILAGAIAAAAGTASAGVQQTNIDWTITNDLPGNSAFKTITISLIGAFDGEILPGGFFFQEPSPFVTSGGNPRSVESIEFIPVTPIETGNVENIVRFTFANDSLFVFGESLVFHLKAFVPTQDFLIGEDYTFVPTPGVAGLAGLGLIAGLRRRR